MMVFGKDTRQTVPQYGGLLPARSVKEPSWLSVKVPVSELEATTLFFSYFSPCNRQNNGCVLISEYGALCHKRKLPVLYFLFEFYFIF